MSCIENINRYIVPNDIIKALMNVYKYIGRNDFYDESTKSDLFKIQEQTVEHDAYYLSKIINLDITDARLKLLVTKTIQPKNREESTVTNIVDYLYEYQTNFDKYGVKSTEQVNMINFIFNDQKLKIDFDSRNLINNKPKREYLDELTDILYENDESIESIVLLSNYFIDIYNIKPLTNHNDLESFMTLYLLLLKSGLNCFRYVSFFELLYNNLDDFNNKMLDASYNWYTGLTQPTTFIAFMIDLINKAYVATEKIVKDYKHEQNISKGDNIENTVSKLGRFFTKEDIRSNHPYVSESTINRALQKLRDENKIKPVGKGRSAKWERTNLSNI